MSCPNGVATLWENTGERVVDMEAAQNQHHPIPYPGFDLGFLVSPKGGCEAAVEPAGLFGRASGLVQV